MVFLRMNFICSVIDMQKLSKFEIFSSPTSQATKSHLQLKQLPAIKISKEQGAIILMISLFVSLSKRIHSSNWVMKQKKEKPLDSEGKPSESGSISYISTWGFEVQTFMN